MKKLLCLFLIGGLMLTGCAKSSESTKENEVPDNAVVFSDNEEKGEVVPTNVELFEEIKESDTVSVIYIGRPTCPACVSFYPTIEALTEELGIDFFYTNLDDWESSDINSVLFATLPGINATPTLAIMYKGNLIDTIVGAKERSEVVSFLTNHNIID